MFPVIYLMSFFDDTVRGTTERQISILDNHTVSEYISRICSQFYVSLSSQERIEFKDVTIHGLTGSRRYDS